MCQNNKTKMLIIAAAVVKIVLCFLISPFVAGDYDDHINDNELFSDLDTNTNIFRNLSAIQKGMYL